MASLPRGWKGRQPGMTALPRGWKGWHAGRASHSGKKKGRRPRASSHLLSEVDAMAVGMAFAILKGCAPDHAHQEARQGLHGGESAGFGYLLVREMRIGQKSDDEVQALLLEVGRQRGAGEGLDSVAQGVGLRAEPLGELFDGDAGRCSDGLIQLIQKCRRTLGRWEDQGRDRVCGD